MTQTTPAAPSPDTREGQAALIALGHAGPYPVPQGVSLGGVQHGAALTEPEALTLAGLPDFVEDWAICPSTSGAAPFTLLWGNAATNAELERASAWAEVTTQGLRASDTPSGSA